MIVKAKPINNIQHIILCSEHYYGIKMDIISLMDSNGSPVPGFIRIEFNAGIFPNYTREKLTYNSIDHFLRDWIVINISDPADPQNKQEKDIMKELYKNLRDNKLKTLLS